MRVTDAAAIPTTTAISATADESTATSESAATHREKRRHRHHGSRHHRRGIPRLPPPRGPAALRKSSQRKNTEKQNRQPKEFHGRFSYPEAYLRSGAPRKRTGILRMCAIFCSSSPSRLVYAAGWKPLCSPAAFPRASSRAKPWPKRSPSPGAPTLKVSSLRSITFGENVTSVEEAGAFARRVHSRAR